MPRLNIRFRDDNGNIIRAEEYDVKGTVETIITLSLAGFTLWLIFEFLKILALFLQGLGLGLGGF